MTEKKFALLSIKFSSHHPKKSESHDLRTQIEALKKTVDFQDYLSIWEDILLKTGIPFEEVDSIVTDLINNQSYFLHLETTQYEGDEALFIKMVETATKQLQEKYNTNKRLH